MARADPLCDVLMAIRAAGFRENDDSFEKTATTDLLTGFAPQLARGTVALIPIARFFELSLVSSVHFAALGMVSDVVTMCNRRAPKRVLMSELSARRWYQMEAEKKIELLQARLDDVVAMSSHSPGILPDDS